MGSASFSDERGVFVLVIPFKRNVVTVSKGEAAILFVPFAPACEIFDYTLRHGKLIKPFTFDEFSVFHEHEPMRFLEVSRRSQANRRKCARDHCVGGIGIWFVICKTEGTELCATVALEVELPSKDDFTWGQVLGDTLCIRVRIEEHDGMENEMFDDQVR